MKGGIKFCQILYHYKISQGIRKTLGIYNINTKVSQKLLLPLKALPLLGFTPRLERDEPVEGCSFVVLQLREHNFHSSLGEITNRKWIC